MTKPKNNARKPDPEVAKQALKEAAERRASAIEEERREEFNGRKGPEPTRYGDWEIKGIASDF